MESLNFFKNYNFYTIQIVFCVDTTGSMEKHIDAVKKLLKNLIDSIDHLKMIQYEFGFVGYRDHPPEDKSYVTKTKDFCDAETMLEFIEDEITADGGGDFPEAVLDGLNDCVDKLTWKKKSIKIVFHIADAPPHGRIYYDGGDSWKSGCPSGNTAERVAAKFKKLKIKYVLIDCGYDRKKKKIL